MAARGALGAAGVALAVVGFALGTARVVAHETRELEHRAGPARIDALRRTDPHATEQTVRLTDVALDRGDRVLVELCAASSAPAAAWEGALHVVAWIPDGETLLFRTPLGAKLGERRHGTKKRCWTVGILTMPRSGRVAIELFWPDVAPRAEIAGAPIDVRVAAYTLPTGLDRVAVALLGAGMLLALMSLGLGAASAAPRVPARGALATVAAAVGLFILANLAAGLFAGGATGLLVAGLFLALAQVGIAAWLSRRPGPAPVLARLLPGRLTARGAGAAVLVGALAVAVALYVPQLLPARGVAPLEAAIAWPSGKLAVGLVALIVPIAEELFFRGLLYDALRARAGDVAAVLGSSALFLAAHVAQDLGNPGALVAVGLTGLLLGTLRAATGSLWPAVLAHVLYDGALIAAAWS